MRQPGMYDRGGLFESSSRGLVSAYFAGLAPPKIGSVMLLRQESPAST